MLLLITGPLTPSISQASELRKCQPSAHLREQPAWLIEARTLPRDESNSCDLVGAKVQLPSGALVTVPLPGNTVTMSAMTASGYEEGPEIVAHTSVNGAIALLERYSNGKETFHGAKKLESKLKNRVTANPFSSVVTGIPSAVTSTKCSYNKININTKSWTNVDYNWKLTATASYPLPGPQQVVVDNLTPASGVWMHRGTTCNLTYPMTKHSVYYGGTTTSIASVNSDKTCGLLPDSRNTVTFKAITDPGTLAYACTYADATRIYDADIAFDSTNRSWALHQNGVTPCSGSMYVLAGVAVHEFGHAYGMAHAGVEQETQQVMRPKMGPCQMSDYSLGGGDLASYYAHYHF